MNPAGFPFRRKLRNASGKVPLKLFDPAQGDFPFRITPFGTETFRKAQRFNYFTILWVPSGRGVFHLDLHDFDFQGPALLFASPYQTLQLSPHRKIAGMSLQFHANFFCIETYHREVGCNGVLFNDIYGRPLVSPGAAADEFETLIRQIEAEMAGIGVARSEALLAYLKVLLIKATRLKLASQEFSGAPPSQKPAAVERLTELIEIHYQDKHSPAEYARLLNMTPKALNKLVKTHFGKTLTTLIRERVLKHAKWQLLHTRKPVKVVAAEVGYLDELYFSRLFKRSTGFAPTGFREFETAIRGGRNLAD